MTADRWTLTLAGLRGEPWPTPPDLPGFLHKCRDAPLGPDDLAAINCSTELASVLGVSRVAAQKRLAARAAAQHITTDERKS